MHHEGDYVFKHVAGPGGRLRVAAAPKPSHHPRAGGPGARCPGCDRRVDGGRGGGPALRGGRDPAGEAAVHYRLAARVAAERSGHREAIAFLHQGDRAGPPAARPGRGSGARGRAAARARAPPSPPAATPTRSWPWPTSGPASCANSSATTSGSARPSAGSPSTTSTAATSPSGPSWPSGSWPSPRPATTACSRCSGTVQLSLARSFQGRAPESLALANRALAVYDPERHRVLGHRFGTDQGVAAHVFAGWSHLLLGHLDRGLAQLAEAVDAGRGNRSAVQPCLRPGLPGHRPLRAGRVRRDPPLRRAGPTAGRGAGLHLLGRHQRRVGGGRAGDRPGRPRGAGDGHPGRNGGGRDRQPRREHQRARPGGRGGPGRRRPGNDRGDPRHRAVGVRRDRTAVVGLGPLPAPGRAVVRRGPRRRAAPTCRIRTTPGAGPSGRG